jgi:hypothetical protein
MWNRLTHAFRDRVFKDYSALEDTRDRGSNPYQTRAPLKRRRQFKMRFHTKGNIPLVLAIIISLTAPVQIDLRASAQRRETSRRALATARWYTFTSPDGDFRIDFPRKPDREEDAQGLVTTIRTYGVTVENGMRFSINFQDIGGDPRSRQNNEWASNHEGEVAAAARNNGERVVQIHRLAKNIIEIELWQTVEQTGASINYMRRDILHRGRVYSLGCGYVISGKEVNKSTCRRFFNSMRFLK